MKVSRLLLMAFLLAAWTAPALAESLDGRHQLELRLFGWSQVADTRTATGPGSVTTSVDAGGMGASLSYGHWAAESWAWNLSLGAMAANVDVVTGSSGTTTDTAVISQILVGARYYFLPSSRGAGVRPFVSAAAGPYMGTQTQTRTGTTVVVESRTETVLGGQFGAGIDFIAGRHFMLGLSLGYNLMGDFGRPIGGSDNYSGPVFGIGFSYLFGRGTE